MLVLRQIARTRTAPCLAAARLSTSSIAESQKSAAKPSTARKRREQVAYDAQQNTFKGDFAKCKTAREVETIVLENPSRAFNEENTSVGLLLLGKFQSRNTDAKMRLFAPSLKMMFKPEDMANYCLGMGFLHLTKKIPSHVAQQIQSPTMLKMMSPQQMGKLLEGFALLNDSNVDVLQRIAKEICSRSAEEMNEFTGSDTASILHSYVQLVDKNAKFSAAPVADKFAEMCLTRERLEDFTPRDLTRILTSVLTLGKKRGAAMCGKLANDLAARDTWEDFDTASLAEVLHNCVAMKLQHGTAIAAFYERVVREVTERIAKGGFEAIHFFDITDSLQALGHRDLNLLGERGADYYVQLLRNLALTATTVKQADNEALCARFSKQLVEQTDTLLAQFSPHDLLSVLHSFELLKHKCSHDLLHAVSLVLQEDRFQIHELSMLARSLGKMDYRNAEFFLRITQQFTRGSESQFQAADFYLMIEAMIVLGVRDLDVCEKLSKLVINDKQFRRGFRQHQLEAMFDWLETLGYKDQQMEQLLHHELDKQKRSLSWSKPV